MSMLCNLIDRVYKILMPIFVIGLVVQCTMTTVDNRKLKKEIEAKWTGKSAQTMQLQALETLKPGEKITAFTGKDLNGVEKSIGKEGTTKKTLLLAFSTSCPACKANCPNWVNIYQKINKDEWDVIGLSFDDPEKTKVYIAEHKFEFPIISMSDKKEVLSQLKIRRIPTTMAIDQNQKVIKVWVGSLQNQLPEVEKELGVGK